MKEKMRAPVNEKTDERRVADRIAELAALERIKERSRLREIISIPVKGQESDAKQTSQARGVGKGTGQMSEGTYMDKITGEIWKQWGWDPTMGEKNLEAVISVLIGRDGTITVKKIEKSSGNRIFDRSALMALRSASPVSPPPNRMEMEIGIRFFL
ncbi:MAG: energy transducer TonB [Candidatus Sulfobium sp.]